MECHNNNGDEFYIYIYIFPSLFKLLKDSIMSITRRPDSSIGGLYIKVSVHKRNPV